MSKIKRNGQVAMKTDRRLTLVFLTAATLLIAGCGDGFRAASTPATSAGAVIKGRVYGGQQPISGANVYLYAANTTTNAGISTNLLNTSVTTDGSGNFSITGTWSCTAGTQVYIVALGGNPGFGTNANAANMAGLGDCSNLNSSSYIVINEVTTVASVFALSPFMSAIDHVGSSQANVAGLKRAFLSIRKLANISNGFVPGSLASGGVVPIKKIYTLADVLASCINTTGGTAGDGTSCGILFGATTPSSGVSPQDTITAGLNIAQSASSNVATLYSIAKNGDPFAPTLSAQPIDWTLSISYPGFSTPKAPAVDSDGNVWIANSGNNTISVVPQSGSIAIASYSGNGLNAPSAIAIDSSGNAWVPNNGANTVSAFSKSGTALTNSPYSPTGVANPTAIAIDTSGSIWITNTGTTMTIINGTGVAQSQITTGISTPTAVAINPY